MERKIKIKDVFKSEIVHKELYTGELLELTSDGKILFCKCRNHVVVLKLETVTILQTIPPGFTEYNIYEEENVSVDDVLTFALSFNNDLLATAHKSGLIKLWRWQDSELVSSWKSLHKGPTIKLAFNSNNSRLFSGSIDSVIRIWDIHNYSHNSKINGLLGVISVLEIHDIMNEEYLFACGDEFIIYCWKIQTNNDHCLLFKLSGHYSKITKILLTNDNKYLISCSRDKAIIVWDFAIGAQLKIIPMYESIETATLLPDCVKLPNFEKPVLGVIIAAAGENGKIRIWDALKNKELYIYETDSLKNSPITHLIYNIEENYLMEVNSSQNIILYKLDGSFSYYKQIIGYLDEILDIAYFGENENYLAVATNSCDVHVYDRNMNCSLLKGHTDLIVSLATSHILPNLLVSGSKDNSIRVWMMKDGICNCVAIGSRHTASVGAITLSLISQVSCIFSASEDCTLKLWHLPVLKFKTCVTCNTSKTIVAHEKPINSICVSSNNMLVATGSQDKTVKLWLTSDLSIKGVLRGHRRGIWCVKFSPVDQLLLSSSADTTLRLWSVTDLSCLKTIEGHDCAVLNCIFINDGSEIVSSGTDGLIKIWLVKDGECVTTLDKHATKVWAITVNKDESFIVSGGNDSRIIFWRDVSEETRIEQIKVKQEKVEQEQRLSNLLKTDKLLPAIELAIILNKPKEVLNIVQSLLCKKTDDLKAVINQLNIEHKEKLLNYVTQWNTNSKHSYIAQLILSFLIEDLATNKLKISSKNIDGLIAYTDRHYNRLTTLMEDLHLVSYSINMMEPHAT